MTIQSKVVAFVALLFIVLIAAQGVIEESVLMPSFLRLERAAARTSMTRVDNALDRTLERLQLNGEEWSNWGELYQFMQDFNPAFLATYTTPEATTPLKINLLVLVDADGKFVFATARDPASGAALNLDFARLSALPPDFPWRANLRSGKPARGLLKTNLGVLLLAAAPIQNGSGAGKTMGLTLMGRLLTGADLRAIGTQAQAAVKMLPVSHRPLLVEGGDVTQVARPFNDIFGVPLMMLQVDVPRSITAQGHQAVLYSSLYLIGAAVMILMLLLVVLNRLVLTKIGRMTRHAVRVGTGDDLRARLDFKGNDEIARLAHEFDRMVERVAESRRALEDHSFQSGFAERAKGIMHNIGNAMTPLCVRLSMLAGRLRGLPLDDVATAAGELNDESVPEARRADLAQFVKLGLDEIEAVIGEAHGDLQVMERQAAIVTATLAEQRAGAAQEHLLESVRLPELLSQALDIVPDACKRRLRLEADDSLGAVGPVTVARTVLRLVLQNLIINAADAVQAAGVAHGRLQLRADIETAEGQPQLHLQCHDNGVGIAPENLTRVFENGFSTKSRATNEGIGLHWCANAIRALGGRIWAASDGPGRGASMHVIFPLDSSRGLNYGS
jgi:sensor domain CHASE-containing protein